MAHLPGTPVVPGSLIEQGKQLASYTAVNNYFTTEKLKSIDNIQSPTTQPFTIGIGSGSTVVYVVDRLAQLFPSSSPLLPKLVCIPTSFQSRLLCKNANLPLGELNDYPDIQVTFDGADEVDPHCNVIKGGGGCHLREKLVASCSKELIIVADDRKMSDNLGTKWTKGVPVEILPSMLTPLTNLFTSWGYTPNLRICGGGKAGPIVTDYGNLILDVVVPSQELTGTTGARNVLEKFKLVPGVIEVGLFCGMADKVYFGKSDGSTEVWERKGGI